MSVCLRVVPRRGQGLGERGRRSLAAPMSWKPDRSVHTPGFHGYSPRVHARLQAATTVGRELLGPLLRKVLGHKLLEDSHHGLGPQPSPIRTPLFATERCVTTTPSRRDNGQSRLLGPHTMVMSTFPISHLIDVGEAGDCTGTGIRWPLTHTLGKGAQKKTAGEGVLGMIQSDPLGSSTLHGIRSVSKLQVNRFH